MEGKLNDGRSQLRRRRKPCSKLRVGSPNYASKFKPLVRFGKV